MGRRKTPITGSGPAAQLALGLSKVRESCGLTLRELAERIGYSPSTLASAERGRLTPSWAVTEAFLTGCDVPAADWRSLWTAAKASQAADQPDSFAGDGSAPAQLPSGTPRFIGRAVELAQLDALAESIERHDGHAPPTVCVIDGPAGVGKTALALQFAHLVARRFSGGQLFVNLQGYGPGDQPLTPPEVLLRLMRGLGHGVPSPAADPHELAGAYRTLAAGKNVLIVLDNAQSVEQVRPVIPGQGPGLIIITSRDRLSGLIVRDDAIHLPLDGLAPDDCLALLGSIATPEFVSTDPPAADRLVRLCERLPLALRIAAYHLATRRDYQSLSGLAAALACDDKCLDVLSIAGDELASLRSVLSWSSHGLPGDAARTLRILSQSPLRPGFSSAQAADLIGGTRAHALVQLRALANIHLLHDLGDDRYAVSRLVALYAAELESACSSVRQAQCVVHESGA